MPNAYAPPEGRASGCAVTAPPDSDSDDSENGGRCHRDRPRNPKITQYYPSSETRKPLGPAPALRPHAGQDALAPRRISTPGAPATPLRSRSLAAPASARSTSSRRSTYYAADGNARHADSTHNDSRAGTLSRPRIGQRFPNLHAGHKRPPPSSAQFFHRGFKSSPHSRPQCATEVAAMSVAHSTVGASQNRGTCRTRAHRALSSQTGSTIVSRSSDRKRRLSRYRHGWKSRRW